MVVLLAHRAWYDLRSTAHAHSLSFHTKHTKAQVYARLYRSLIDEGALRRQFRRLSVDERAALQALQAAGGTLPQHRFQKAFGAVRLYRPWRSDDTPKMPWKHPQSIAEKLWYLGFIEIVKGRPDQVLLPEEVLSLLPPLPLIEAALPVVTPLTPSGADALCVDVALMLGALLFNDIRPLHGRWIPLRALRRINPYLRTPDDLNGIRSELQTGRLRFLHYLAEAAGLVAVQGGFLKPTVQAWHWLDLSPDERWQKLISAIADDLKARDRRWDRYRLPPLEAPMWRILVDHLQRITPDCAYLLESLINLLRPYLPAIDLNTLLPPLLGGPLNWLGLVTVQDEVFARLPLSFSESHNARLVQYADTSYVILPAIPRLRALVTCCEWTEVKDSRLQINADTIRRALETGSDSLKVGAALSELIGGPLPAAVFEQIQLWARAAKALTVRQVCLLTAQDADTLNEIRSDWRLRALMGEPLSPHHVAVSAGRAEDLLTKLERRGYRVTGHLQSPTSSDESPLSSEMVEYLWLAVRVYQKLGALVSQDIAIPGAAREWLTQQLPAGSADSLEAESQTLVDKLSQAIRGHFSSPAIIQQEDSAAIQNAVQSAYARRGALTIEYFSPMRGEKTTRTIEPVMLYERNGAAYVEAWCRLDGDTRTFRLDRILKVIADGEEARQHPP